MKNIEQIELKSKNIKKEQMEKLEKIFPEIVSEGKINFEKFKLTMGEEIETSNERYNMSWAGKSNCFKIIQEPSIATLKLLPNDSVDFDKTMNLFIEGDNLEVLKLLQKSYYGKIKMIYIDPPYNTGQDFVYTDKFGQQLEEYLKLTGQSDSQGRKLTTNPDSSGRYHSNWMNMMYPRLFLAKNLLTEDGMIFISIDDNEVSNLRKICDEIFGEDNFESFIWKKKGGAGNTEKIIGNITEYILCYFKDKKPGAFNYRKIDRTYKYKDEKGYYNLEGIEKTNKGNYERKTMQFPIIDPKTKKQFLPQKDMRWTIGEKNANEAIIHGKIYFDYEKNRVYSIKRPEDYEKSENVYYNLFLNSGSLSSAKDELLELLGNREIFETPKPTELIMDLLEIGSKKDSIILDFFAGSGTTAHAVLKLNISDGGNRKFICIQLPEPTSEDSEAFKAGYKNIAEITKERIRRSIRKIKEEQKYTQKTLDSINIKNQDLGFKAFKLDRSNFKIWDPKTKSIQVALTDHVEQIKESAKPEDVLYEILLKDGFELTTPIKKIKVADREVYSVENNFLLICLDKNLTLNLFKDMKILNPHRVIVLDKGFNDNDQLKTNAVQGLGKNDEEEFILRSV